MFYTTPKTKLEIEEASIQIIAVKSVLFARGCSALKLSGRFCENQKFDDYHQSTSSLDQINLFNGNTNHSDCIRKTRICKYEKLASISHWSVSYAWGLFLKIISLQFLLIQSLGEGYLLLPT